MTVQVSAATRDEAAQLAEVAAACFPLACPPSARAEDITAFVAEHLSAQRFAEYLDDPRRQVFAARQDGRIVGYAMLIRGDANEPVELSKMYVLPEFHRSGAAAELMSLGIDWAGRCGARAVWLGVNRANERAQRFYGKQGFEVTGERTFRLGDSLECDYIMERRVMQRPVTEQAP